MIQQGLRAFIDKFRVTSPNSLLRPTTFDTQDPFHIVPSQSQTFNKPQYKIGHADPTGPFFKTAAADLRVVQHHAKALTKKYALYQPDSPFSLDEIEQSYENALTLGHAPLERRIYEILDHAIFVNRAPGCVGAFNRELAHHAISGKNLQYVTDRVENIGKQFYGPQ